MGSISVMDWNSNTASKWEWENLAGFCAKTNISNWVQLSSNESEGDGGIDNASMYSSGGGGFSGSDLGHVTSSKSSISASGDSSLKEGMKTYGMGDSYPEDSSGTKELSRVDSIGNFPSSGASAVSGEPIIGLKLGKRTYFEDVCAASTTKSSSFSIVSSPSVSTTKRSRALYQSSQTPRCQVEGCNLDLKSAKDYHRRHRICENHSKSPKVIVAGMERRFCQQCSRFHELSEFDDKKRSCRRRLSDHNARRRRPQPEAIQFNYGRLSSPIYDGRQQMNVVLNGVPFHAANPAWQNASGFRVTHVRDSPIRPSKAGSSYRQRNMPSSEMLDATSMVGIDSEKVLSFESSTPRVFSQGLEASAFTSNSDVAPDFRRALSLLSTTSWGVNEPDPTSLDQLMHVNQSSVAQPVMQAEVSNWRLAPSQLEQVEQPPPEPQVNSLNFHSNSSNFQEFQLFKAPHESGCFLYSSQIN